MDACTSSLSNGTVIGGRATSVLFGERQPHFSQSCSWWRIVCKLRSLAVSGLLNEAICSHVFAQVQEGVILYAKGRLSGLDACDAEKSRAFHYSQLSLTAGTAIWDHGATGPWSGWADGVCQVNGPRSRVRLYG